MDSSLSLVYADSPSLALMTDLYQLTMSYGYWKLGMKDVQVAFHLFFRRSPFAGGYVIAAGLEDVIRYIENFRFDTSDLDYLGTLKDSSNEPLFPEPFLKYLQSLRFEGDLHAMPEGSVTFPHEPLIRIEGPIIQCQLLESPLLNLMNFSSLIATKASRIRRACGSDPILEFGLRRAQGINGALTASRAAFIGGCNATSNVLAGKIFGIPVQGTHSHSWVMAFNHELESFEAFADAYPSNCVFLVDTYNSIEGVKHAITVGQKLRERGKELLGIRLDSGDLAYISIEARSLLDEAGFSNVKIYATNELNEEVIIDLKRQGAQIAVWGIGTHLVTAKDQPALDGVYKLSAVRYPGKDWEYRLKLSEQMLKISNPGLLQVRRYFEGKQAAADTLYDYRKDLSEGCTIIDPLDPTRIKKIVSGTIYKDLLVPIFQQGKCVYNLPSLKEIQKTAADNLSHFHEGIKRFIHPHQYPVGMEKELYDKKVTIIRNIRYKMDSL